MPETCFDSDLLISGSLLRSQSEPAKPSANPTLVPSLETITGQPFVESMTQRLQPQFNQNAHDRMRAWNEWLLEGGSQPVLKFIRWANGTTTEDDEILQETLIVAFIKVEAGQYEERYLPFTAFLKKIAWYKIMEASRRFPRQIALEDVSETAGDEPLEHERAELWREREALQKALASLSARRRCILGLYEAGFTTAEIAEQLGIQEALVRKEKSLAMRQLREEMSGGMALAS